MSLHYLTEHETRSLLELPLYLATVQAGFPSPADDYMDKRLDLNEHLIKHDAATFYCRVSGNSMEGADSHSSMSNPYIGRCAASRSRDNHGNNWSPKAQEPKNPRIPNQTEVCDKKGTFGTFQK